MKFLPVRKIKKHTLTVTLLNTQSLRKRVDYILMEKHLISNDVIGFIETTLGLRQNNKSIKVKLQN